MAQVTLNPPPFRVDFNTGDGSERGDTPFDLVTKLQAMQTELYGAKNIAAKYTANAASGATTAAAGDLTGAQTVVAQYSAVGANNLTTRTAAQMIADANMVVGQSYYLEVINSSGGTMTIVGGSGVVMNGTATLLTNTIRYFIVTVQSASAISIQNVGSGPFT